MLTPLYAWVLCKQTGDGVVCSLLNFFFVLDRMCKNNKRMVVEKKTTGKCSRINIINVKDSTTTPMYNFRPGAVKNFYNFLFIMKIKYIFVIKVKHIHNTDFASLACLMSVVFCLKKYQNHKLLRVCLCLHTCNG